MSDGSNDGSSDSVDLVRQRLQTLNKLVIDLCDVAKDKEDEKLKVFEESDAPATVESLQQEVNELRTELDGICDAISAQEKLRKELDDKIELKKEETKVLQGEIENYVQKLKDLQGEIDRVSGEFASGKKIIRQMKAEMEAEKKALQLLPEGNVLIALIDLYDQKTQLQEQFRKDIEDTRNELTALLNSNIENEVADLQARVLDLQLAAKSISPTQGRRCALS